jgi:hypothetical protein
MRHPESFKLSRGALISLAALIAWVSGVSAVYSWLTGSVGVAIGLAILSVLFIGAAAEGRVLSSLQRHALLKSRGYAMIAGWIMVGLLVASLYFAMPESSSMRRAIAGALGGGTLILLIIVVWQTLRSVKAEL